MSETVVLSPLIMGVTSMLFLVTVPQMEEIYISILDAEDYTRGLAGLACFTLFSALLYCRDWLSVTRRIDLLYPRHADLRFDRGVAKVRDIKTIMIASLPFVGLMLGLLKAHFSTVEIGNDVAFVTGKVQGLPKAEEITANLAELKNAIPVAFAITLVACAAVMTVLHVLRRNRRLVHTTLRVCEALTVLLTAIPIFAPESTLNGARFIGPLAGAALVFIAVSVVLRYAFWLVSWVLRFLLTLPTAFLMTSPRSSPAPLYGVLLGALAFATASVVKRDDKPPRSSFDELSRVSDQKKDQKQRLAGAFQDWLKARRPAWANARPKDKYPVFVVAAEGGGIYAASAASFFLASLQDRCPEFASHVFAISAVSGGSIGASLFDTAFKATQNPDVPAKHVGCTLPSSENQRRDVEKLTNHLTRVNLDDHITPVMAYFVSDLLHGLIQPTFNRAETNDGGTAFHIGSKHVVEWLGRDQILERSFVRSVDETFRGTASTSLPNNLLRSRYEATWRKDEAAPALVLNTTWVETGYRVAFAPFPLAHIGKNTLYSFADLAELSKDQASDLPQQGSPSLIKAASISARFPVIMPPWLHAPYGRKNRWTFVDGGYADSSGATTALELFTELENILKTEGSADRSGVDLYLIILTDALTEADLDTIDAGWYDDLLSPLNTLLTVRRLLAKRAIAQAYSELDKDKKLIKIELDQNTFPLPLGWKISETSSDLIRLMMGAPEVGKRLPCSPHAQLDITSRAEWAVSVVKRNSCELAKVVNLVDP